MFHPIVERTDLARAALELVREAVLVVDRRNQRIVDVNRAACEALARPREHMIDRSWLAVRKSLPHAAQTHVYDRWMIVVVPRSPDPLPAPGALRDTLTGLVGREALMARGPSDRDPRATDRSGLLFIDLDDFKQVNDTWGHLAGDEALRFTAQRLGESVRPRDLVVRYGGDEFVVLVDAVSRRRDLERLARRISRSIERPLWIEGHEVKLSASIGIAWPKSNAASIRGMIAEADRAMYRSKSRRRAAALVAPAAPLPAGARPAKTSDVALVAGHPGG